MSSQVRVLLLAVTVGVAAMIALWMGQSNADKSGPDMQITGDSVARYATDEFVAACCVLFARRRVRVRCGAGDEGARSPLTAVPHRLSACTAHASPAFPSRVSGTDARGDDGSLL